MKNCQSHLAASSRSQQAMSRFDGLIGPILAALVSGCGSTGSNPPGADGGTTGNDRSTDLGPPSEGGGEIGSSDAPNGDRSVDSGSPGSDSGSPGSDSGSPGSDSGSPGSDSGSPGSDSGSPDSGATDLGGPDGAATPWGGDGSSGDASADEPPPANDSGGVVPLGFFVRYEAESPLNSLTYPVEGVVTDGAQPCSGVAGTNSDGVKEGANCASGGHVVNQLLGRSPCAPPTSPTSYTACGNKGGGITFEGVTVPADGAYDVTFWYHSGRLPSGSADVYGDVNCGGLNYNTGTGSGCRPHLIYVNGVQMSSTVGGQTAVYYQFPAYPDSWSIVHGAVVALSLKAGSNAIYIKAPGYTTSDAADLDALDVQPSGPGGPSFQSSGQGGSPLLRIGLVTPVVNWN
jgi:hypothetical protein